MVMNKIELKIENVDMLNYIKYFSNKEVAMQLVDIIDDRGVVTEMPTPSVIIVNDTVIGDRDAILRAVYSWAKPKLINYRDEYYSLKSLDEEEFIERVSDIVYTVNKIEEEVNKKS